MGASFASRALWKAKCKAEYLPCAGFLSSADGQMPLCGPEGGANCQRTEAGPAGAG